MITLKASKKQHDDNIRLTWRNSNNDNCLYRVFRRKVSNTLGVNTMANNFEAVGVFDSENNKSVRVLNIHPNCGEKTSFKDFVGEEKEIRESESMIKWMLEPNKEAPLGYGLGAMDITSCSIADFNNNPQETLFTDKECREAKYNVVCVGFFDGGNGADKSQIFTSNGRDTLAKYIDAGYGVIVGHDYISGIFGANANLGPIRSLFNIKLGAWGDSNGYDYGFKSSFSGDKLKVNKSGSIMSYPWFIGVSGDEIDISPTHTTSQFANSDIWLSFAEPKIIGDEYMSETQKKSGNFYLTKYKSTAMIQIGNTNDIKNVEKKILANTIFALHHMTNSTTFFDNDGIDDERPSIPKIHNYYIDKNDYYATFDYESEDIGVNLEYYVEATYLESGDKEVSNIVSTSYSSGLKNYRYLLERIKSDTPDARTSKWIDTKEKVLISEPLAKGYYSFKVMSIDNNDNRSDIKEIVFYMPGEVKREESSAVTKYPNVQRVNHRYRGPHESRKANDVVAQVKFNLKKLRSIISDLDKEKDVLLERPNVNYVKIHENRDVILDRIKIIKKNRLRVSMPSGSVVEIKGISLDKQYLEFIVKPNVIE